MSNSIEEHLAQAHSYWREGNEKEMLIPLEKALAAAKQEQKIAKTIEILNEYGGALRVTGNYPKAVEALTEALDLIDWFYSRHSEAYATTLTNLANVLRAQGSLVKSEKIFLQAKELYENLNLFDYPYASLCNNLSLVYQNMGEYKQAYQLLMNAVELIKDSPRLAVPLAISYNNLFEICKQTKQPEAESYLVLAEELLRNTVGKKHPLYAVILNNMASVFYKRGEFSKSLSLYEVSQKLIRDTYGEESRDYQAVTGHIQTLNSILKKEAIAEAASSIPCETDRGGYGMEAARHFFETEILALFQNKLPEIFPFCAFGLVGQGSECYEFDDAYSRDHDFKTRCCLWLPRQKYLEYIDEITTISSSLTAQLDVYSIEEFYKNFTLCDSVPQTIQEWLRIPQDFLSIATNGQVFMDNLGQFTAFRKQLLAYYPEDIRLKKMAYCCNKIAQSGQYNYFRCLKRNNQIGAQAALGEFIHYYSECVHLINRRYLPFYKWVERSLSSCPLFGQETTDDLNLLLVNKENNQEELIETMCRRLVSYFNAEGLSQSNVSFLTYQAEEIMEKIKNPQLKRGNSWVL
ncbi:DUF4037 domain-containing protein [Enterococcus sp. LJL128]